MKWYHQMNFQDTVDNLIESKWKRSPVDITQIGATFMHIQYLNYIAPLIFLCHTVNEQEFGYLPIFEGYV